jgi:hypothetical protein
MTLDQPVGDVAQAVVEEEVPGAEHRRLGLLQARAHVIGRHRHHLGGPAVEEDRVPRLVDQLRGEEHLHLAARRREDEGRQVGSHPLLTDVEARHRPRRVALRLRRRGKPVLTVDREVELVGAPVALLPQRVELLVAHQVVALARGTALGGVDRPRHRAVGG